MIFLCYFPKPWDRYNFKYIETGRLSAIYYLAKVQFPDFEITTVLTTFLEFVGKYDP